MARKAVASFAMSSARSFGRVLGCELVVNVSDHSIETSMELPDKETRAWDSSLYKRGQLFVDGYANPIKPRVIHNNELDTPDTIDITETDVEEDEEEGDTNQHIKLISSGRYRQYMHQDLISQMINPREQWRLLVYGIIGVAVLQFLTIIVTLYATGSF